MGSPESKPEPAGSLTGNAGIGGASEAGGHHRDAASGLDDVPLVEVRELWAVLTHLVEGARPVEHGEGQI